MWDGINLAILWDGYSVVRIYVIMNYIQIGVIKQITQQIAVSKQTIEVGDF